LARASLYDFKKDGIVVAIERLTEQHGRAPSLREIAEVTDTSVATLHSYLTRLRMEGLVSWAERHHRSLQVVTQPSPQVAQRIAQP
jgi:SOS-response transcriptional repressor LexA